MLGMNVRPPDQTPDAAGPEGLMPAGKGMQALLIAAISASSLSLLFSIGTAALSAAPDQGIQQTTPPARGEAGTENSRTNGTPSQQMGRADTWAEARVSGDLG